MVKNRTLVLFKEYFLMTLAMVAYVGGWVFFLIPNKLAGGGVTGFSTIINYAFNIPISYTYFVVNVLLLLLGTWILGKGFGFKTIYCVLVSSLFFEFMPMIPYQFQIPELLTNILLGAGLCGLGIAVTFMQGGSTGGIDIIALVINKYREVSPGRVYMVSDTLIITSILLLPHKTLTDVVYGYIFTYAFAFFVDKILTGDKQSVKIFIMSKQFQAIADILCKDCNKGVTAIESIGWHTKAETKILMVVCRKNAMPEIMKIIKQEDSGAFITVSNVMAVYGEGFDSISRVKTK